MCQFGVDCYTENFDHNIQQLLSIYPPDYKTIINEKEVDFWSGSKRLPHPIKFDPNNDLCLNYVIKFVQILAHAFSIPLKKEDLDKENIKKICEKIKIPEFVKKLNVKIDLSDDNNNKEEEKNNQILFEETEEMKKERESAQKKIEEIFKELEKIKREDYDMSKINPEEFEKDHEKWSYIFHSRWS